MNPAHGRRPFAVLRAADPGDRDRWLTLWQGWPHREVFSHPGYAELFAGPHDDTCAAVWDDDASGVLYCFIQRSVPWQPGSSPDLQGLTDISSPYGYGGPYSWGKTDPAVAAQFWGHFDQWAHAHRVVSEFVRFDLRPERLLPYPGVVVEKQSNVVRDLRLEPDALWRDVEHKVRKNVKRATQLGVRIEIDSSGSRLSTFLAIYRGTMLHRQAPARYLFAEDFFARLHHSLPGQFIYFFAYHDGVAVAAELVLASATSLYSFLGGTKVASFDLRPNDLLKWEIIRWGQQHGMHSFILGGGFQADDGIFRYKRSFSPNGCVPLLVGQRVLEPETYARLVSSGETSIEARVPSVLPVAGYFPEYRSG